jgi:hypothetical protein
MNLLEIEGAKELRDRWVAFCVRAVREINCGRKHFNEMLAEFARSEAERKNR